MCTVHIYEDKKRNTWRVRVRDTVTKKKTDHTYPTEAEARAAMPELERKYRRPVGVSVLEALDEYRNHLATRGNRPGRPNRPRTIEVTMDRLTKLLAPAGNLLTGELTPAKVRPLWEKRAEGHAVDTNLNTLSQAKTFIGWLLKKGWIKLANLLDGIEVLGRRSEGKEKLTQDEAVRFSACAIDQAKAGDIGAAAAECALLMGMRATEIVNLIVRDFDAGGTKIRITKAKTRAGIRVLKVPVVLQPLLKELARGKKSDARLFGERTRYWLYEHVQRLCRLAGVPEVSPHGLRGTHSQLAVEAGASGDVVARSLGHESFAVTERHYAGSDAVAAAKIDRVAAALGEIDDDEDEDPSPKKPN